MHSIYICINHDDVITGKPFSRYWSLVRGIHRSLMDSPHNPQGPVTRSFDVFFDVYLNKRLNKQWGLPVIWHATRSCDVSVMTRSGMVVVDAKFTLFRKAIVFLLVFYFGFPRQEIMIS